MATKETIEALYKRYLNNDISKKELEDFLQMLHTPENELTISSLMDGTWQEMFETAQPVVVPMYKRTWYRIAAAAVVLLMLSVGGYLYFNKSQKEIAKTENINNLKNDVAAPTTAKATITLADGRIVSLDSLTSIAQGNVNLVKNANGEIIYSGNAGEVAYNTLSNPRGSKVVSLTLGDGTQVWLNSESSIKYPTSFTGNERKVEITGEAYFEVAYNATKPFKVNANGKGEIEVLGTHFNVNAYDDEEVIKTTLLEGSVRVSTINGQRSTVIKPGQQAVLTNDSRLTTHASIDLTQVMAWQRGLFEFNNTELPVIMRQISRWYDVNIVYEAKPGNEKFGGGISKNLPLSNVLKLLEANGVKFTLEGKILKVKQ